MLKADKQAIATPVAHLDGAGYSVRREQKAIEESSVLLMDELAHEAGVPHEVIRPMPKDFRDRGTYVFDPEFGLSSESIYDIRDAVENGPKVAVKH
jgi:hypothetical protein